MMDAATGYRQSDPNRNPGFSRRWHETLPPPAPRRAPTAAPAADEEPGTATLRTWVEEWRRRRAARPLRPGAAR